MIQFKRFFLITIMLSSRKLSLSEVSWFADITSLISGLMAESRAHYLLFFLSKENADAQVRSHCGVAEVIHA